MGIVKKQGIPAAFIAYLGVGVAFLNGAFLFPRTVGMEIFGFTNWMLAVLAVFNIFGDFSSSKILVKYLPYFKRPEQNHYAFFTKLAALTGIGILISLLLSLALKDILIEKFSSDESKALVQEHFNLILFGIVFFISNNYLNAYCKAISRIRIPALITDLFGKYCNTLLLVVFFFGYLNTEQFLWLYIIKFGLQTLTLFFYIKWLKTPVFNTFPRQWKTNDIAPSVWKDLKSYGFVTILSGSARVLSSKIDSLMIASMLGFVATGVYAIIMYMTSIMNVAYGVIVGSLSPLVAQAFAKEDYVNLKKLYVKSAQISFLTGTAIFVLTVVNLDSIFEVLGPDYESMHKVYYILGLGALVFCLSGSNGLILNYSKRYYIDIFIKLIFLVLTVLLNLLLIEPYGLMGAAVATMFSIALYNLTLCAVIYKYYQIHPFTVSLLKSCLVSAISIFIGLFIWEIDNIVIRILITSILTLGVFGILAYFLKVSEDINLEIDRFLNKWIRKI